MPNIEMVPAQVAAAIDTRLEEGNRMLYRVEYFSEIHPDPSDLQMTQMVKVAACLFAEDANDANAIFSNNVPDEYPVRSLIAIAPMTPMVLESHMLEVSRGPRAVQ